jgi:predicted RNase H-like HicB family nuclease
MASYTAIIRRTPKWWVGWIEEIPGVNCQGKTRKDLVENLRSALTEMLELNRAEAKAAAGEGFEEEVITLPA